MPRGGKQSPLSDEKKERIVDLYLENQDLTVKGVAERIGCATSTAWNVLFANGIEIRGASKWATEKEHTRRILRRWEAGGSSAAIARKYGLQREGVARVIAANRPYDQRMRKMLKTVFGSEAETIRFLRGLSRTRNTGRCAICRIDSRRLVKDYCHSSGTLRDLLCRRCNQGLGCFDENVATIIAAIAYLLNHSPSMKKKPLQKLAQTDEASAHDTGFLS